MRDEELLRDQAALRAEATALYEALGLAALLRDIGRPQWVGSAALGVLVVRDLDLDVACECLDGATLAAVTRLGACLGRQPAVRQVTFRDDTGRWNTDPLYPDGLYLGVRCAAPAGEEWNLDVWFVDEPTRQPSSVHLATLAPRFTEESRLAVLRVKHHLAAQVAEPAARPRGYEVYRAVLDHGVRTPEEFDRWAAAGGR